MKTDIFQSCGHCWIFQICCHIECSTFTTSSFRIWNSSAGIPSLPLALFVVMLSKAHLSSYSKMSGSRWVITPSWLSGSWRSFFVQFCVFLPPLLNIFCFCQVHTISAFYWTHPCMKPSLGISNFLVEISSLSHSVVFSISLFRVGQINQLKVLILRESIPREVDKNSGALKEEIRVWNSQGGGKDKIFFFFFLSLHSILLVT